jgi:hypothetical protein
MKMIENTIKIGFIHLGGSLTFSIKKLVRILNRKQKKFLFELISKPKWVDCSPEIILQDFDGCGHSFYTSDPIINKAKEELEHTDCDYLIAFTGLRLGEYYIRTNASQNRFSPMTRNRKELPDLDFFSITNEKKKVSIITETNYHKYCNNNDYSIYQYLIVNLVNSLLLLRANKKEEDFLSHYELKGCIGDYCFDQKEITQSIRWSKICPKCKGDLKKANVSVSEIAAIENILKFNQKEGLNKIVQLISVGLRRLLNDFIAIILLGIISSQIANIIKTKFGYYTNICLLILLLIFHIKQEWTIQRNASPPN